MNATPTAPAAPGPRRTMQMAWMPIVRTALVLLLFVVGFALDSVPGEILLSDEGADATIADYAHSFALWFGRYLTGFTALLVALVVADRLTEGSSTAPTIRSPILVGAWIFGATASSLAKCALPLEYVCRGWPQQIPWAHLRSQETIWTAIAGGLIALAYFQRRRDRRVGDALHAAELARVDAQRATLAADLQSMQARVEPDFLFETLGAIGERYDHDQAAGESLLNELIRHLRAVLPDLRTPRSTVARELALARTYFSIREVRSGGRIVVAVDAAAGLDDLAVAPMIVLPLLTAALGPERHGQGQSTSLRLEVRATDRRIRFAVAGTGPALRAFTGNPAIEALRTRLTALYGEHAALTGESAGPGRFGGAIEIPREAA